MHILLSQTSSDTARPVNPEVSSPRECSDQSKLLRSFEQIPNFAVKQLAEQINCIEIDLLGGLLVKERYRIPV